MLAQIRAFPLKYVVTGLKSNFKPGEKGFSSSTQHILIEKTGNVTAIAINAPDRKNQLDEETFTELCLAVQQFEEDDSSPAGVIYGVGGNFCTGCTDNFVPDSSKLIIQKPLVAALTGYTTGYGFELALICDLRVIEATAQVGLNASPTNLLPRLSPLFYRRLIAAVGSSLALDLALTGRNVICKEAFKYGLANRLVDCGTGVGQAFQLAKTIGKFPISALREAKSVVYSELPSQ